MRGSLWMRSDGRRLKLPDGSALRKSGDETPKRFPRGIDQCRVRLRRQHVARFPADEVGNAFRIGAAGVQQARQHPSSIEATFADEILNTGLSLATQRHPY